MSDGDIQFPPGKRREAPKFEPPPWEREKFEELARARQAQEGQHGEETAAEQVDRPDSEKEPAPPASTAAVQGTQAPEPAPAAVPGSSVAADTRAGKEAPSEEQVALLLAGLRAEEPRASEAYVMVSMVTGIALAIIGLAVTTWGAIVLITPKEQGATTFLLVSGLLVPGLGFLGGGVWLVISTLRRQGVL